MFYPVDLDLSDASKIKQGLVVLNPSESRRFLAKVVVNLPEVRWAYKYGRLAVPAGGTNAFVLEELTGEKFDPYRYCVGFLAHGMLTMSVQEDRAPNRFFYKAEISELKYPDFLRTLEKGDVIIKGANAVDPQGNVGVLLSNDAGGMVGAMFGVATARGIPVIVPVGLEKQIASVPEAAAGWGQLTLDYSMGMPVGLSSLTSALVITEVEALAIVAGVRARLVASGGIGGSEGAVVILIEGYKENIDRAIQAVQAVKGEPNVEVPRHHLS